MSAAEVLAGAAPGRTPDWHSIDWRKVWRTVCRLQARIVKAVAEGRWNKVKALVYLLTHSFGGRALAILRVVSNSGAGSSAKRVGRKSRVTALKPLRFKDVLASLRREESAMITGCENNV